MSLEELKTHPVWDNFLKITRIPRPSGKEEKIREHLISFAKKNNFKHRVDKAGNLAIEVPASNGYEKRSGTILQGHMDMVAAKTPDSKVDPEKDPLDVYIDGDFLKARGTTLGADNGIGLAYMMSLAEDKSLKHGPLELLFTANEETGLVGAFNIDPNIVKGERLINMDADTSEVIFIGSGGAEDHKIKLPLEFTDAARDYVPYQIKISGLKGGHSGLDIIFNRANAIKLLAGLLEDLSANFSFEVASISGGDRFNAIPRDSQAIILIRKGDVGSLKKVLQEKKDFYSREYSGIEEEIKITLEPGPGNQNKVLTKENLARAINFILAFDSSITAMSRDIPGLVETSNNMGVVKTEKDHMFFHGMGRSCIDEAMGSFRKQLEAVARLAGAEFNYKNVCPVWKPDPGSALAKKCQEVYREKMGKEPRLTATHAGAECGLLSKTFGGIEAVSFGPDLFGPHSPDERVSVKPVEKLYEFLKYFIESLD